MATIDIRRSHTVGLDTAKVKAEELARDMEAKLDMEWSWDGERIRFEAKKGAAKGTKGHVTVGDKEVRVEVDLPFLLRALKGKVSKKVTEKLDALLT